MRHKEPFHVFRVDRKLLKAFVILSCAFVILGSVLLSARVAAAATTSQDASSDLIQTDKEAKSKDGFVKENGETFYYKKGKKKTGWVKVDGEKFYFYKGSVTNSGTPHTKGAMATGWQLIDGEKFYFYKGSATNSGTPHTKGAMATGWQLIDGEKYYFYKASATNSGTPHTRGAMATGWQLIDGEKYYFYKSGSTPSGITHAKGSMATDWQTIEGRKYYFFKTTVTESGKSRRRGAMATGWQTVSGTKYYFCKETDPAHKKGEMATGGANVDGKGYVFDKSGKLIKTGMKGWYKVNNDYYYCDRTSGKMVFGEKVNGIELQNNGTAKMTDFAKEKIPVMIKAREVVAKITSPSDTVEQKMWKCYRYSIQYRYMYRDAPIRDHINDWACFDAHYANNILNAYGNLTKLGGECCAQSFCMGYLFTELNIGEVKLQATWKHGWVVVGGLVYDANYTKDRGAKEYWGVKRHPVQDEQMFETVI